MGKGGFGWDDDKVGAVGKGKGNQSFSKGDIGHKGNGKGGVGLDDGKGKGDDGKGKGKGGVGFEDGKGGKSATRSGDWICQKCWANVFASKAKCFKCDTPRPSTSVRYYETTDANASAESAPDEDVEQNEAPQVDATV